jgi:hypothetical protein
MSIEELEEWFRTATAPEMPVYLNAAAKVNDYDYFLTSHFEGLRAAKNEFTKAPLLERLLQMKLLIECNL